MKQKDILIRISQGGFTEDELRRFIQEQTNFKIDELRKLKYVVSRLILREWNPQLRNDEEKNLMDTTPEDYFNANKQDPAGHIGYYETPPLKELIDLIHMEIVKAKEKSAISNNDKLSRASEWMDPLMKKITNINLPTHEEVLDVFILEYPGFDLEFQDSLISTYAKGRKLIKSSVGKALKFIFEKKHPNETITSDAIIRRYNARGFW